MKLARLLAFALLLGALAAPALASSTVSPVEIRLDRQGLGFGPSIDPFGLEARGR